MQRQLNGNEDQDATVPAVVRAPGRRACCVPGAAAEPAQDRDRITQRARHAHPVISALDLKHVRGQSACQVTVPAAVGGAPGQQERRGRPLPRDDRMRRAQGSATAAR
jgi:hypothetical protein